MTTREPRPEPRLVGVVRAWTCLYTRGLPADETDRRRSEIDSDIWEQLNDPEEVAPVRSLVGRWIRGVPADLLWRIRTAVEHRRVVAAGGGPDRNVWVVLAAVFGVLLLTHAVLFGAIGVADAGDGPRIASLVTAAVAGGLVLGGLVSRAHSLLSGSYAVIVGCALAIGADPLAAFLSVPLAISGVWTGNLQLSPPGDDTPVLFVRRQRDDLTRYWYRWVIGAVALGAIGFVPLIVSDVFGVADECTEANPCTSGSVLWATWILSWFLGMVTAGVGVILGALRVIVTRLRR